MPIFTTGSSTAALDVVWGPARRVYERLQWGSQTTPGVTPGRFYDRRGYPVPYRPGQTTDFIFRTPDTLRLGTPLQVVIHRYEPQDLPPHEVVQIVPDNENFVFGLRLDRGLHYIEVQETTGRTLASMSVSATRLASVARAYAQELYRAGWYRVDQVFTDVFWTNTGLFKSVLIYDALLAPQMGYNLMATYFAMQAAIPCVGTETGLLHLGAALFEQTLWYSKPYWVAPASMFLFGCPTTAEMQYDRRVHLWMRTTAQARAAGFSGLMLAGGNSVESDTYTAEVEGRTHYFGDALHETSREDYVIPEMRYEGGVAKSTVSGEILAGFNRAGRGVVQYPGLWDGQTPFLDSGDPMDAGRLFDADAVIGIPEVDGFVGVAVVPQDEFMDNVVDVPAQVSVLVSSRIDVGVPTGYEMDSAELAVSAEWSQEYLNQGSGSPVLVSDTQVFQYLQPTPEELADVTIAAVVTLVDPSGVEYVLPAVTRGNLNTMQSGTPVTWVVIINSSEVEVTGYWEADYVFSTDSTTRFVVRMETVG